MIAAVERAFRDEWAAVLAPLARRLGDLQLAEDATQDAFLAAAERWERDGVPERPGSWLALTARRKALDRLRRERAQGERAAALAALVRLEGTTTQPPSPRRPRSPDRPTTACACCSPAATPRSRSRPGSP